LFGESFGGGSKTKEFLLDDGVLKDLYSDVTTIFTMRVRLSRYEQFFKRKAYTLLDMIGDIGALYDGLIYLVAFFVSTYNNCHFLSSIMETLFTAKTDESPSIPRVKTGSMKQKDLENITSNLQK